MLQRRWQAKPYPHAITRGLIRVVADGFGQRNQSLPLSSLTVGLGRLCVAIRNSGGPSGDLRLLRNDPYGGVRATVNSSEFDSPRSSRSKTGIFPGCA
jgi:hypothetical protein